VRLFDSPGRRLLLVVLVMLGTSVLATWYAAIQPTVGAPSRVVAVTTATDTIAVSDTDLIEEPDFLDEWSDMDAFFARQTRLAAVMRSAGARVAVVAPGGVEWRPLPGRHRDVGSLPFVFWFQLLVGGIAVIVGAWIWSLRPGDAATRAFALTGLGVMLSSFSAAVYSTREVALPGAHFRALSATNHLGATLFGVALCGLLLVHPRRLSARRWIPFMALAAALWWASDILRIAPDQNWGTRVPLLLEMSGAVVLALVQWRLTAHAPAERAVLRWFGISVLVGPGLFILMLVVAAVIGNTPPIPQGYGMGFFLLTYLGMAIGLRRYRLFALDAWALRVLFWSVVCAVFLTLDLAVLRLAGDASARAMFVVGMLALATLPVRRWVWTHVFRRPLPDIERTMEQVIRVAYAATPAERAEAWRACLRELFDPLGVNEADPRVPESADRCRLLDDGERLYLPAVADDQPLVLVHAGSGRRLFTPEDVRLGDRLLALLRQADERRTAYEAGVRGERQRIAKDLHDTVSSPLLSGLAQARASRSPSAGAGAVTDEIARALEAMRDVVREADERGTLERELAEIRFECVTRLHAAGLIVHWPIVATEDRALTGPERLALRAFFREATSNVIRHASATTVAVTVTTSVVDSARRVIVCLRDDGHGLPRGVATTGQGIPNMRARAETLGGMASIGPRADHDGTEVRLEIPLVLAEATP
jgi:signal transduction histidine kinase